MYNKNITDRDVIATLREEDNVRLDIVYDDCSDSEDSPRNWDNLGIIVAYYSNHNIGDVQTTCVSDVFTHIINEVLIAEAGGIEFLHHDIQQSIKGIFFPSQNLISIIETEMDKYLIWRPLYLYNHSGIAVKTTPFNCRWDSGKIGYIYVTKATAQESFVSAPAVILDDVYKTLDDEVNLYDQYIQGDVYRWEVLLKDLSGEWFVEDSCGGYYKQHECEKDGINSFSYHVTEHEELSLYPIATPIAPHGDYNQLV